MNPTVHSKRKRVLFVDHVDRILGGAEINLLELIEEAQRHKNWEIAVACRKNSMLGDALDKLGVRQFEYGFSVGLNKMRFANQRVQWSKILSACWSFIQARNCLAKIRKQFQPTAVISCTNKDHFATMAALPFRRVQRIWWVNDLITPDFFSYPARWIFSELVGFGPGLVAVSESVQQALLRNGATLSQVQVIPNGIPLERYRRVRRGYLRQRLGIPEGESIFGNIGRLTPWKGQKIFIELAEAWVRQGYPGHFVLIGKAYNEDQAYEQELLKMSGTRALEGRIHFVGVTNEIAATLSDLDALIHTSIRPEPFGRVLIEAMAVGTPVVAADAGGPREIITDSVDGLLANPGDVVDYGRKLRLLTTNPEFRQRIITRARQTVEARFTIQWTVNFFDELLRSP